MDEEICDCIKVTYQLIGEEPVTVYVDKVGEIDGYPYYQFEVIEGEGVNTLLYDSVNWYYSVVNSPTLASSENCPFGTYTIEEGSIFESFVVASCTPPRKTITY